LPNFFDFFRFLSFRFFPTFYHRLYSQREFCCWFFFLWSAFYGDTFFFEIERKKNVKINRNDSLVSKVFYLCQIFLKSLNLLLNYLTFWARFNTNFKLTSIKKIRLYFYFKTKKQEYLFDLYVKSSSICYWTKLIKRNQDLWCFLLIPTQAEKAINFFYIFFILAHKPFLYFTYSDNFCFVFGKVCEPSVFWPSLTWWTRAPTPARSSRTNFCRFAEVTSESSTGKLTFWTFKTWRENIPKYTKSTFQGLIQLFYLHSFVYT